MFNPAAICYENADFGVATLPVARTRFWIGGGNSS
jgi:hypothetical protein